MDVTVEKPLRRINNIYVLTVLAAKRAVSLCRGAKSLLSAEETKQLKTSQIVMEEIIQGKITYILPKSKDEGGK